MENSVKAILQKDQIIDCINRLFICTDNRDWPKVRNCFDDQVQFDMTSLGGGSAMILTPQQITDMWDQGLRPINAIHHQAGNYRVQVQGDTAKAFCYGIASHFRPTRSGRNTRVFVGSYEFEFAQRADDWRITSFRFNCKYIDGNLELEKED